MHKLASLLLTLSATTAFVQAENIKGTVVDKVTKEPLIGATIQVAGTTMEPLPTSTVSLNCPNWKTNPIR